jgi:hypothetical protein
VTALHNVIYILPVVTPALKIGYMFLWVPSNSTTYIKSNFQILFPHVGVQGKGSIEISSWFITSLVELNFTLKLPLAQLQSN